MMEILKNKIKLRKIKKALSIPMEATREAGALNGYTCPRCGKEHCIYEYCLACGQKLYYDYAPIYFHNFKDVDEMCEKLDYENSQLNPNIELSSLSEERKQCKIDLSDLIKNDKTKGTI